jgi:hypothetical protein
MSRVPLRRALALFTLLGITAVATAQEPPPRPFGEGTHTLRAILNKMQLEPIPSERQFRDEVIKGDAARLLVIVLGEDRTKQKESVLDRIDYKMFLDNGGAILVASDRELCNWAKPPRQVTSIVTGAFVQATQPESMYRGSADCPFVHALANEDVPVFDGLRRVATNRPSYLNLGPVRGLGSLARFPQDCQLETQLPVEDLRRHGPFVFAAGGRLGKKSGRMLVLADHSVFINDMMLQTDNDNFDLAWNALRWLSEKPADGKAKRDRVLFVDEGTVVANFNVVLKELPLPPLPGLPPEDELIRVTQNRLAQLQRENYFNTKAVNALGGEKAARPQLILILVVVGTLGLVILAGLRLGRARHRIDPRLPLAGPGLWETSAATLPAQRQQALVQAGNFWEPARALARQFFEAAANCRPDSWATAGRRPPQIHIAEAGHRRRIEKELRALWRLAASSTPYRVAVGDFQRLVALLPRLQTEILAGERRGVSST